MSSLEASQQVRITVMLPADAAQSVGGKLYVLGGGFDRLQVASVPTQHSFDVALLIEIPWTATNEPHTVVVELLDADGAPVGYRAEAVIETGRPPGARQGASLVSPLVFPVAADFPAAGRYVLRGAVNGQEQVRAAIEVALPE